MLTGDFSPKVWSSAQKGSLVVGSDSYTMWQIGSVDEPSELWLEGYASYGGRLTLEWSPDGTEFPGGTYNADIIDVTAVSVDVDVDDYDDYWDPEEVSLWREESVGAIVGKHADNLAGCAPEDIPINVHAPSGVPYGEDWSVTLRTETGALGNGGVLEIWDYSDDPYNPVNLGSSATFDNGANPIPADGKLKIRGETASILPRDVSLILEYDVQGRTIHDTIHFTVVQLGLEDAATPAVPKFLFASATYATPVRFKVGLRDGADFTPMWLHQIQADLILGGVYEKTFSIGNRFVNNSGTTQDNGAAEIYTGYIRASDYSTINLGDAHRIGGDYTYFDVWVECSLIEDGPKCWVGCYYHPNGKMELFFDDYIFAVEPGINGVHDGGMRDYDGESIDAGLQGAVDMPGEGKYYHFKKEEPLTFGYCDPANHPLPHEEPEEMEDPWTGRIGMDKLWGMDEDEHEVEGWVFADGMITHTRLYDDADVVDLSFYGQACKARFYGLRRGAYFMVSYGGKELGQDAQGHDILGTDEYAMDVGKTNITYYWELFPTGDMRARNKLENTDGLYLGHVSFASGGFSLALLLVPGYNVASTAFGVLSGIIGAVDMMDRDSGDIENRAEGRIYKVHKRYRPGETEVDPLNLEVTSSIHHGSCPTAPWDDWELFASSRSAAAGDQLVYFVQLDSVCTGKSHRNDGVEIDQSMEFKCDTSSDFNTMRIRVYESAN